MVRHSARRSGAVETLNVAARQRAYDAIGESYVVGNAVAVAAKQ